MNWQGYITSDKDVLMGKPVISGTRISVSPIVELFASGWTEEMISDSYPNITKTHLQAVSAPFGSRLVLNVFHSSLKSASSLQSN